MINHFIFEEIKKYALENNWEILDDRDFGKFFILGRLMIIFRRDGTIYSFLKLDDKTSFDVQNEDPKKEIYSLDHFKRRIEDLTKINERFDKVIEYLSSKGFTASVLFSSKYIFINDKHEQISSFDISTGDLVYKNDTYLIDYKDENCIQNLQHALENKNDIAKKSHNINYTNLTKEKSKKTSDNYLKIRTSTVFIVLSAAFVLHCAFLLLDETVPIILTGAFVVVVSYMYSSRDTKNNSVTS